MVGSSRCSARIDSSAPRRARLCGHSSGVIISSTASPTSATRSCSEPPCCRRSSSRGSSPPRPLVDAASPRSTRRPTDCLAPPTCPRWRLRWKRFVPASPATSPSAALYTASSAVYSTPPRASPTPGASRTHGSIRGWRRSRRTPPARSRTSPRSVSASRPPPTASSSAMTGRIYQATSGPSPSCSIRSSRTMRRGAGRRCPRRERSCIPTWMWADAPVNLADYPLARSYLESHRAKLSARKYLREARRNWFEIWVPQRPSEWPKRKIVFPDIAESPRFLLDTSKAIVNGDCYWMALGDEVADDLAYLLLAVGNSSFAMRYYDAVCGNRLYAGRRRFITQYVKTFPLPERRHPAVARIVGLARELVHCQAAHGSIEDELNDLVCASFGLEEHDPIRGARPGR